jgi:hypothetical protein
VEGLALPLRTLADLLLKSFVRWRKGWHLGSAACPRPQTKADAVGEVEWEVSVDDTVSCGLTSTLREHAQGRVTKI